MLKSECYSRQEYIILKVNYGSMDFIERKLPGLEILLSSVCVCLCALNEATNMNEKESKGRTSLKLRRKHERLQQNRYIFIGVRFKVHANLTMRWHVSLI